MRRSRLAVVLALALIVPAGSHLIRPDVAVACAPTAVVVALHPYIESSAPPFFLGAEGSPTPPKVRIARGGHDCFETAAEVSYKASDDQTTSSADHNLPRTEKWTDLEAPPPVNPGQTTETEIPFTAAADGEVEEAVEIGRLELVSKWVDTSQNQATIMFLDPIKAPVYIVDADGDPRFRLSHASYSQLERRTSASVPVIRAGPVDQAATVGFTIGPGTVPAKPGEDYVAPASGEVSFERGERLAMIDIALVDDDVEEPDEEFIVTLTGPGAVAPTSATFTILDNDRAGSVEEFPPSSRFHHPKHKTRYDYDSRRGWYLREIHVFTSDQGSGVVRTQMALRKKMQSGKCSWWAGSRFKRRPCAQKKWLRMKGDFDFYFYRIKELKPTVGTNIKNYTAFSRAIDGAGNVEDTFKKGRNANTFTRILRRTTAPRCRRWEPRARTSACQGSSTAGAMSSSSTGATSITGASTRYAGRPPLREGLR